ncbi:hypothetical protein BDP27DRAFT_1446370 [Rhodocollybia butyracea]|uniref:Uncharacterized protein n=1 Tax=Rhodocollybia butyracea TaxID=206335 RepID=A0A9P5Q0Q5_9AGAR|nr:hypothetical protein BDP27DRAFT_1446370 [Rhodocollybia butyracea]
MFFTHRSLGFILFAFLVSLAFAMPMPPSTPPSPGSSSGSSSALSSRPPTPEAPAIPHTYFVQVLDKHGHKVQLTTEEAKRGVQVQIKNLAGLGGDGRVLMQHIELTAEGYKKEFDSLDMIYFNLTGHNFATKLGQPHGYGYITTVITQQKQPMVLAGVVSDVKDFTCDRELVSDPELLPTEEQGTYVEHVYTECLLNSHNLDEDIKKLVARTYSLFFTSFAPISKKSEAWVMMMAQMKIPVPSAQLKEVAKGFRKKFPPSKVLT